MNGFLIFVGIRKFECNSFLRNILPNDYFIILYSILYLVSPLLNKTIGSLTRKQYKKAIVVLFSIFSVYSFLIECMENFVGEVVISLSPISANGSGGGIPLLILFYFFYQRLFTKI